MKSFFRELTVSLFALFLAFVAFVIAPMLGGLGLAYVGIVLTEASVSVPTLPLKFLVWLVGGSLSFLAMLLLSKPLVLAGWIMLLPGAFFISVWLDRKMRRPPIESIEDFMKS